MHHYGAVVTYKIAVTSLELGVGLFQQRRPELTGIIRLVEDQLIVRIHRQEVVDYNVYPFAVLPKSEQVIFVNCVQFACNIINYIYRISIDLNR